ncbi:MAG: sigma-70 family RNA polymerase sigma factor [Oscillospiraceae bacterium]|nr:sigma-70 family RNA polymerase sigma factor [Oscillospiraceae bacterium]
MVDKEIVSLYLERKEEAITETERKYGAYCRQISRNILTVKEDAEECVNDAYHAAWMHIPPDEPQRLKTYLGKLIRNLAISRYRKNRAAKRYVGVEVLLSELDDCVPDGQSPERAVEAHELTQELSDWLLSLKKEDRILFLRRYWYGFSVKQLAQERGCKPNAAAQRLYVLRCALRDYLTVKGVAL